jgi:hypothetical protein
MAGQTGKASRISPPVARAESRSRARLHARTSHIGAWRRQLWFRLCAGKRTIAYADTDRTLRSLRSQVGGPAFRLPIETMPATNDSGGNEKRGMLMAGKYAIECAGCQAWCGWQYPDTGPSYASGGEQGYSEGPGENYVADNNERCCSARCLNIYNQSLKHIHPGDEDWVDPEERGA